MQPSIKIRHFICSLLALTAICFAANAQSFNNEWINYSNTYYKFKVGKDSIYQISAAVLQTAGLGATPAQNFRLYRNGVEVPIYTSVASGPLPANGYIEFLGKANDGAPDRALYRNANFQHLADYSLHSDTAVYFLTVESGQPNKRFTTVANNIAGNSLPAEPWFMHTQGIHFHEQINRGFASEIQGESFFSSSYDVGEFWSSWDLQQQQTRATTFSNLKAVAGGPDATLRYGVFGNANRSRTVEVAFNGSTVQSTAMNFYSDLQSSVSIPVGNLTGATSTIGITNQSAPPINNQPPIDRLVISYVDLVYPREFDFNGSSRFYFELPVRAAGYYLEIKNFNSGSAAPVLYDTETLERYIGDISQPGMVRFALNGSGSTRRMILAGQQPGVALAITALTPKTFTDYSSGALQGDFLIISNPKLYGSGSNNPVEAYRQYRSSAAGGSFQAKLFDINELTDQFAFGIKGHPSSVRNFVRFARANFSPAVSTVLLIGKGVDYFGYKYVTNWSIPTYAEQPRLDDLNLVPTFGFPGSDNLLVADNLLAPNSGIQIGRISAVNATEVDNYLQKLKEYESAQRNSPNTIDGRLWMKNIVQVTGASDAAVATDLCNAMEVFKTQAEDTLLGASVYLSCKSFDLNGSDQSSGEVIHQKFDKGMSLLTYYGHSSASTLEFSIENPEAYNNTGKYPVFSVNGCYAGDFFRYSAQRFNELQTLTEKYVLTKQKGSIAFLASTHFGVTFYLDIYLHAFYTRMGKSDYGKSIGTLNKDALADLQARFGGLDFTARVHAEQITIHGDPALVFNFQAKPDYVIEEPQVLLSPTFISVADQNFTLKLHYYNMGKATNDSVHVEVKRTRPDGTVVTLFSGMRPPVKYMDSMSFVVPIVATTDKGENKFSIVLDGVNKVDEMEEGNNSITKSGFIYEDGATPIFPYNYAIVNNPAQIFYASTADPFLKMKQYIMEMDTTALFNSALKKTVTVSSVGGILEFNPQMSFMDSTVYYWRTALVPEQGAETLWSKASFLFRNTTQEGFNQSHFYQHTNSVTNRILLDSAGRSWNFTSKSNDIFIRQATYPTASGEQADFTINPNEEGPTGAGCTYDELIIHVLDKNTFKLWPNTISGGSGLYGSYPSNCGVGRGYNYEYLVNTAAWRKKAMDFLDLIPDGSYVVIRNNNNPDAAGNTYPDVWRSDTSLYGHNNSLYHRLFDQGFTDIDSFNRSRGFVFVYRKNDRNSFDPVSRFTADAFDKIAFSVFGPTPQDNGNITSPVFGPAKKWHELRWEGKSVEATISDKVIISLIGIRADGVEQVLREVGITEKKVDISDIDPVLYPSLRLTMDNRDSTNYTPYQLEYWRLIYDPVPEGALAPNLFFTTQDTVALGGIVNFGIAFKNVSKVPFDSLKIKVILTDRNNVPHELPQHLLKPLISGDTVRFSYPIDTKNYPGLNTLYVEFNPDNHQPEQYHFNNFLFRNLYVQDDNKNPLLDVTFDGQHILNGDIVSAKPMIQIKLKDESKYLLLKDTSLIKILVKFPDGTLKTYLPGNDTVRFTPAVTPGDNTATIDFSPSFLETFSEDGIDNYELRVTGRDASNNPAGKIDYSINFLVINKPMISNLLNYPNPFTTSTAFVFTITGSEIPTNFKIQILTVTGKVVREITGAELGNLRIGRNITDFKWDGTDQFGQRLANGVYLYRVITTLHGKKMDKFKAQGDNTDKYFNRGYGKMYLMR